jgi:hypothetical protein
MTNSSTVVVILIALITTGCASAADYEPAPLVDAGTDAATPNCVRAWLDCSGDAGCEIVIGPKGADCTENL